MSLIAPLVKKKKGQAAFDVVDGGANVNKLPQKMCTCPIHPNQQHYNGVMPGNYNMTDQQQNQYRSGMNQAQMHNLQGQFHQPPVRFPCSVHPSHHFYKQ